MWSVIRRSPSKKCDHSKTFSCFFVISMIQSGWNLKLNLFVNSYADIWQLFQHRTASWEISAHEWRSQRTTTYKPCLNNLEARRFWNPMLNKGGPPVQLSSLWGTWTQSEILLTLHPVKCWVKDWVGEFPHHSWQLVHLEDMQKKNFESVEHNIPRRTLAIESTDFIQTPSTSTGTSITIFYNTLTLCASVALLTFACESEIKMTVLNFSPHLSFL